MDATVIANYIDLLNKREMDISRHLHYSINDQRFRTPEAYIIIYKDAQFTGLVVAVVFFVLPADFVESDIEQCKRISELFNSVPLICTTRRFQSKIISLFKNTIYIKLFCPFIFIFIIY